MTGRQRLLNILNNAPIGRVTWTTLVDDRTLSAMPAAVRDMPVLDFYSTRTRSVVALPLAMSRKLRTYGPAGSFRASGMRKAAVPPRVSSV